MSKRGVRGLKVSKRGLKWSLMGFKGVFKVLRRVYIGMGLGQNFAAQGRFGPGLLWAGPRLGPISNLTFGPGPGLDFPSLGWIGPWAIQKINIGPLLGQS